jgi:hypothetical protein
VERTIIIDIICEDALAWLDFSIVVYGSKNSETKKLWEFRNIKGCKFAEKVKDIMRMSDDEEWNEAWSRVS